MLSSLQILETQGEPKKEEQVLAGWIRVQRSLTVPIDMVVS